MAVPLSTYFMDLILAIRTCFYGETKGMRLPRPGTPSREPQGTEDETLQPRINIGFRSRLTSALMLSTCDNFASGQVLRRGVFVSPVDGRRRSICRRRTHESDFGYERTRAATPGLFALGRIVDSVAR